MFDVASGRIIPLTKDGNPDTIENSRASWSPDSKWIAFIQSDVSAVPKRSILVPGDPTYRTFREERYVVAGRKLVFSEIAENGGRLIQGMDGGFCGCSRPNNSNSPAPPTPLLSDLTRGFAGGGFQAARRTGSDRARSRASSSRPMTCRL